MNAAGMVLADGQDGAVLFPGFSASGGANENGEEVDDLVEKTGNGRQWMGSRICRLLLAVASDQGGAGALETCAGNVPASLQTSRASQQGQQPVQASVS
jgi:hypothetical protein